MHGLPGQLDMFRAEDPTVTELTSDELTVLLIAHQGERLIPMGRWEAPVKSLAAKGLLRKENDVNYVCTDAGHAGHAEADKQEGDYLRETVPMRNAFAQYQLSSQEACKHLVVAAKSAASVTGDSLEEALQKTTLEVIKMSRFEIIKQ